MHLPSSDIDLMLTDLDKQISVTEALEKYKRNVLRLSMVNDASEFYSAPLPHLRLNITSGLQKLRVNITVEGSTHCSPERSQFIQRALNDCKILKPVYLALKHIVYYCEMNESQTRGLSSYGLFLMVLSYIQNQSTTWMESLEDNPCATA